MPIARPVKKRPPRRSRFRRKAEPWTRRELARLGKSADSKLARRNRRTIQETVAEREARRIALPTAPRRWTAKEIRMLGHFSDREVARRLRRSQHSVRYQRKVLKLTKRPQLLRAV